MNPHPSQNSAPQLTRDRYQALRRHYRLARREDNEIAARMPVLSSTWRKRPTVSRTAAIEQAIPAALVATFGRPQPPVLRSVAGARLAQRNARRGRAAVLADAVAKLREVRA